MSVSAEATEWSSKIEIVSRMFLSDIKRFTVKCVFEWKEFAGANICPLLLELASITANASMIHTLFKWLATVLANIS